jgi:site-specific DNA-methyltransferase (adenine-specific)
VTIYYQDEQVTLYHGDCLEITDWLGADVLVTDPPYGIAWHQRLGSSSKGTRNQVDTSNVIAGDGDPSLRDAVLAQWAQKPAVVFGNWRVQRPAAVRSLLIWHKANSWWGTANQAFYTNHEDIYVLGEGWPKSTRPLRSVITTEELRSAAPAKHGHPTPKPVRLMEILIDRCPPGVIADPFAGSGSTLIAARNLGRKAIGVEIEERYCEIIARRLDQGCFDFGEGA